MGTKRVGLARVEALIENLKRDLDLSSCTVSGGLEVTPVSLAPAASVTLTKAANANRINFIPSTATADDEYVLPVPTSIGETYSFVWSGAGADTDTVIFKAGTAGDFTLTGAVLSVDEDEDGGTGGIAAKLRAGAAHEKLTVDNPTGFNISFVASSLTNYVMMGWASSTDTHVATGDV